jgi:glycosyltransferase involved in cell wall biosynthesis
VRVLYVNHTATVSGAERSLLVLLGALPPSVEPLLATPEGALASAARELGVPVTLLRGTAGSLRLHPVHTPRALAEMGRAATQLRRAARVHDAEVVHANSVRAGIELGLAHIPRAASVVHVRDCLPPSLVAAASMRLISRTSTTIVANSHYTARSVRASAPHAHVEVIHPAIDLAQFDPARIDRDAARAGLGVAGTRRLLLGVVAQLSPWKGQDTAIEALALLREEGVDAHLLLIGSAKFVSRSTRLDNTSYAEHLRQMIAELQLGDHVSLLGERDDVPALVRALDALLLPSREEPFGRALLEAMALEVPVLATSVGGPPELVRDGREGFLLPPGEPEEWARAARLVLDAPDAGRELGRAGRARIAEAFTAQDHATATLELYERALAAERGRR